MSVIFPGPLSLIVGLTLVVVAAPDPAWALDLDRLQYGEQNRHHVTLCAQGNYQSALDYANRYVVEHPDDLEAYFIMAMAQANLGQVDAALNTVQLSLDKGLTLDRYLAGPRELLAPLHLHPGFVQLVRRHDVRLVHGPALGGITDRRARFWVRTAAECTVTVSVHTRTIVRQREIVSREVATNSASVTTDNDYTAVVEVAGLEPNTQYTYFVSVDGRPVAITPASLPGVSTFQR
jgi:alkaline phosphatase D